MNRVGSMFTFFFQPGPVRNYEDAKTIRHGSVRTVLPHLLENGVYFPPSQFEAAFVSAAHTPQDIAQTMQRYSEFFAKRCLFPMETKRRVLVTGSAKRIGRVIAIELFEARFRGGYSLQRDPKLKPRQVSQECGGAPVFQADLGESGARSAGLFREIRRAIGTRCDCLVNNAARFTEFDPLEITEADWDFIHDVNLKGDILLLPGRRAADEAAEGGGRIVNISSLGGIRPWAEHAHYCASKAGVIMLTKALAKALAPRITVNSVAPGVIAFNDVDARVQKMIDATPMKRAGTSGRDRRRRTFFPDRARFHHRADTGRRRRSERSLMHSGAV